MDLTALGEVFAKHKIRLLAMLQRRIPSDLVARVDADDLLSETFLAARRRWSASCVQRTMTAYAWLYRIAMNCLIEAWRRETHSRARNPVRMMPLPESSAQVGIGLVGSDTGPSTAAARKEMQGRMRQTMEMLGPRDQEILWMRAADGLSFAEAGAILGIDEGTATVRYLRALRRLRKLWKTLYGENDPR